MLTVPVDNLQVGTFLLIATFVNDSSLTLLLLYHILTAQMIFKFYGRIDCDLCPYF
jgi:hypothetical protein